MPVCRLVLDVRRGDGDAARLLFRSVVDRIKRPENNLRVVLLQYLGDRRRQRRLAMVDVTNRPYVAVRLCPLKFFFRHFLLSSVAPAVAPAAPPAAVGASGP